MATVLRGARVHLGDALVEDRAVLIAGGRIEAVLAADALPAGADCHELDGGILAAGFLDTQVNGGGGALFNDAPEVATLATIAQAHRRFGTTGLLPTIISDEPAVIDRAMRAVEAAIAAGVPGILGIHIEGPMLSPSRPGIHDPARLSPATPELLDLVSSLRTGRTLVTLAPEAVGPEAIARLVAAGVTVSAGHTAASFEEMRQGFAAGITGVTHLFNAMTPLESRAPGAVGAALDDQEVWCGIIADGVHVHPAALRVALRSRPLDRFMLVTDAMSPAGTEATSFELHGRTITVTPDRLVDANATLAGANLTMIGAVRNAVELLALPWTDALALAARTPAAFLGMSAVRGQIAPGLAADLVWLREDGTVGATWIDGAMVAS